MWYEAVVAVLHYANEVVQARDSDGSTPLLSACHYRHGAVMDTLLLNGADSTKCFVLTRNHFAEKIIASSYDTQTVAECTQLANRPCAPGISRRRLQNEHPF